MVTVLKSDLLKDAFYLTWCYRARTITTVVPILSMWSHNLTFKCQVTVNLNKWSAAYCNSNFSHIFHIWQHAVWFLALWSGVNCRHNVQPTYESAVCDLVMYCLGAVGADWLMLLPHRKCSENNLTCVCKLYRHHQCCASYWKLGIAISGYLI